MFEIANPVLSCGHCAEYEQVSHRTLLSGSPIAALPSWMPRIALADPNIGPRGDTLVCIFLRGGADGLNMIIPHGDEGYYSLRPTIGIARPDDNLAEYKVIDLDGFFGLHPSMVSLKPIFDAGDMAAVHATGAPDETRSHFEAMALMERGAAARDYSGWIARHLATLDTGNTSALRALALGEMLPASLTGAVSATALQSIGEYHLQTPNESGEQMRHILAWLYEQENDLLSASATQTFAAMDVLSQLSAESYQPNGRAYPETDFGQAMKTVAQLIHADVGVEVACIDLGGWDTHAGQGGGIGLMARLMTDLAEGLTSFYEDLITKMNGLTVVVMSEFGRRAKENAALGTDHGHGNMMIVLGDGIVGGHVYSQWPGLHPDQLVGPGDLPITIDYRDVLGEILAKRLNNPDMLRIFPGYTVNPLGLAIPRV